jgi:hypothetical protein
MLASSLGAGVGYAQSSHEPNETTVAAPADDSTDQSQQDDQRHGGSSKSNEKSANHTDKKAEAETRLTNAKFKACQKRETAINNRLQRIATHGERQLEVFSKIAERTEAFYTAKGHKLSNYDALVAEVNAKKAAAETTMADLKAKSVAFKCDGSDPKGAAQSFKDSLRAEQAALKAYKTAVKNLIVGVKSAEGSDSDQSDDKPTTGGQP